MLLGCFLAAGDFRVGSDLTLGEPGSELGRELKDSWSSSVGSSMGMSSVRVTSVKVYPVRF